MTASNDSIPGGGTAQPQPSASVLVAAGGTGGHLFPAEALARQLVKTGAQTHLATDRRAERRAASAVQTLRRLGLDATELAGAAGEADLLVLPEEAAEPQTAPSTTVLRVRPAASDVDEDLQQALARIAAPPH